MSQLLRRQASRLQGALLAGSAACYATYQAVFDPPHLVWDLDHTLLCSVTPLEQGKSATSPDANEKVDYFDQIDDDFPYDEGTPNTRTFWRPGARAALRFTGTFATQHVYTAAQATYTDNIMQHLDPDSRIFASVTHRDMVPHHDYHRSASVGKDLTKVPAIPADLSRTILFDDKVYNFTPQPENGIQVKSYKHAPGGQQDWEIARLCLISVLALLVPGDVRPLLRNFRSDEQRSKFGR